MAVAGVVVRRWRHSRGERAAFAPLALVAAATILAACGSSDTTTTPVTGNHILGVPKSWKFSPFDANSEVGIENISAHGGTWAAYMHGSDAAAGGMLSQALDATPYQGMRVKVSAWVDESFTLKDGLFGAYIYSPGQSLVARVSIPAPTSGSDTWHQVFVVFDVPSTAVGLNVFGELFATGQLFFDDVEVAVVDSTVPTTPVVQFNPPPDSATLALYSAAPRALANGDFESGQ